MIAEAIVVAIIAVAGLANYIMLLSINAKLSQMNGTLREWARSTFADQRDIARLEERIDRLSPSIAISRA